MSHDKLFKVGHTDAHKMGKEEDEQTETNVPKKLGNK